MDVEVMCPSCNRRNFVLFTRTNFGKTVYKRCIHCKEGIAVKVQVRKVKDIERFLSQQRNASPKPQTTSNDSDKKTIEKEGVSVDGAPTD